MTQNFTVKIKACEKNGDKLMAAFEMHKKEFTFSQMNVEAEKIGAAFLSLGFGFEKYKNSRIS